MRLRSGTLKTIKKRTGISTCSLCDYSATRKRPGRKRALFLESVCRDLGLDIPAMVWLYGESHEIKKRLSNGNGHAENKD